MVDILFLAHKRPEFTRESLKALIENTPEDDGDEITVYTDGGPIDEIPNYLPYDPNRYGGPVACLNQFLEYVESDGDGAAEFIVKIDNDCCVPPGWLPACLDLMRQFPSVDLLGIEGWTPDQNLFPPVVNYGPRVRIVRPVSHIGGIGVFRRSAFERFGRPVPNSQDGRYGFTEWMWANPGMVKAFIDPPLPVFLLDHLPFEPWVSLGDKYESEGVQRHVGWKYDAVKHRALWDWWFASREAERAEKLDVGGPRL